MGREYIKWSARIKKLVTQPKPVHRIVVWSQVMNSGQSGACNKDKKKYVLNLFEKVRHNFGLET